MSQLWQRSPIIIGIIDVIPYARDLVVGVMFGASRDRDLPFIPETCVGKSPETETSRPRDRDVRDFGQDETETRRRVGLETETSRLRPHPWVIACNTFI